MLALARLGTLPFLVLLLWATWLWARRLLPAPGAAALAVLLLASVPAVLGHAALATLDVAAASTCLLALYALELWLAGGRWRDAALFGLAAGLAVSTKFSAIPFIGLALPVLALLTLLVRKPVAGAGRYALGLALAALVALVPLALAYGPRAVNPAGVALRYDWAVSYLLQRSGADHALGVLLVHGSWPRALKDLVNGVVALKAHNDSGHLSYLLGHVSTTGWWYFYLVALIVKTPIPLLVAGALGLAALAREGWRTGNPWGLAPAALFIALLGFASAFSHINIGIRHVLVLYPLLALGAAFLWERAWRALPTLGRARARLAAVGLALLLTWQLSTLYSAYPDYLPYFNEAVWHPERVLVDSDLDWGQDLRRLERRAAELHVGTLNLAYRGTADLAREPLPPLVILQAREPVSGWVAISALARTRNPPDYAWLDRYRSLERIGKTIDLYYIP